MYKLVLDMRENLFNYDMEQFYSNLDQFMILIRHKMVLLNEIESQDILDVNLLMQESLKNNDFLFVTDLAKFVVCPIFERKEH